MTPEQIENSRGAAITEQIDAILTMSNSNLTDLQESILPILTKIKPNKPLDESS